MYEIRSYLNTGMTIAIPSSSKTAGASVIIYSVLHSNAQIFYIDLEGTDSWSIRNVYSGMYVAVSSSRAASGTNVIQWNDTDSVGQRWKIVETGETATVSGVTCPVVTIGSYVTTDAGTYMLDVENGLSTNSTNVQIYAANGTRAQKFVLYPTTKQDATLPVPSMRGWTKELGGTDYSDSRAAATTLYPAWLGTQSWASNTTNGWEGRWRERTMDSETSTWGDWGGMTAWADLATTRDGTSFWLTSGLPASLSSEVKSRQYEFQLRAFAGAGTNRARGLEASMTLDAVTVPVVTLSNAGFGPDGLRIPYVSDYDGGTTNIRLTSIKVDGQEVLASPAEFDVLATSGTIHVPMDLLSDWIDDGSQAAVTYQVGNDQVTIYPDLYDASIGVSYDSGSGLVSHPTVTVDDDRMLVVDASPQDITGAWVRIDGELFEADVNDGIATIAYPFGKDFDLFIATSDGGEWGTEHMSLGPNTPVLSGVRPCHAFNWDGGSFLLELREGEPFETTLSMSADSEALALNGREWESVYFGSVVSGASTVEGALHPGVSKSRREQVEGLVRAHHVIYRSPVGDMWDVAVMSATPSTQFGWSNVSVTFRRESR